MSMQDGRMPRGWHVIKSVLLTEIATAANFHHCERAADALFHARLMGESCARENQRMEGTGGCSEYSPPQHDPTRDPEAPSDEGER